MRRSPDPAAGDDASADGTSPLQVRQFALAMPEASEAPHFDMTSFRVRGKIFATMPPLMHRSHPSVRRCLANPCAYVRAAGARCSVTCGAKLAPVL